MSKDTWLDWYHGKEGSVEEDVPALSELFRKNGIVKILDVVCGTGRHVFYFAKMGFKVSGFDWSATALKRASGFLRSSGLSADLLVWDMESIPYPYESSSFEAVVAIKVVHHARVESIRRIFGEIERVIRRGGVLYLQVPMVEKAMRLEREGLKSEKVEEGTFLPLEGDEKGILHHYFTKGEP